MFTKIKDSEATRYTGDRRLSLKLIELRWVSSDRIREKSSLVYQGRCGEGVIENITLWRYCLSSPRKLSPPRYPLCYQIPRNWVYGSRGIWRPRPDVE